MARDLRAVNDSQFPGRDGDVDGAVGERDGCAGEEVCG